MMETTSHLSNERRWLLRMCVTSPDVLLTLDEVGTAFGRTTESVNLDGIFGRLPVAYYMGNMLIKGGDALTYYHGYNQPPTAE